MTEKMQYEAPSLTDMGDFGSVTMGKPVWGFEPTGLCIWQGCATK
ncbi:lasso RiPP family leader peptide-containing protein [Spirillospora sp. CA-253888]